MRADVHGAPVDRACVSGVQTTSLTEQRYGVVRRGAVRCGAARLSQCVIVVRVVGRRVVEFQTSAVDTTTS